MRKLPRGASIAGVSPARNYLLETLRHVLAGGDVTNAALDAAIPDPGALHGAERKAWHGLSYWAETTIFAPGSPTVHRCEGRGWHTFCACSKPKAAELPLP